jgi:pyruvate formate lyase activating enzyme
MKTSLKKYARLGANDVAPLLRTIETLKTANVEYEFRTTVVPGFVDREDIIAIGEMIKDAENFCPPTIQSRRHLG